jgi:methyltransferase
MVNSQNVYFAVIALVGLERLAELVLSKRHAARAFVRGGVETGQAHYRVMTVLHTAFLASCVAEVGLLDRPYAGAAGGAALAVALLAQGLRWWAIATLGDRWNTRVIVLPHAEPVTGGPYRFVRHPNYVAVVAELAALPLIHGAWLTAVVFSLANAWLLTVRIRVEEKALGDAWRQRFEGAPRFIPGGPRGEAH